ncbi:MAG: 2-dehydropantoate 2-reductase [Sulfolobales archaeon]
MLSVSVVGGGSVGSLLVYSLNRSSVRPVLVFKRDNIIDKISIESKSGDRISLDYTPALYDEFEKWINSDIILIATKAYDAEYIIDDLRLRLPRDRPSLIVFSQNGLKIFEKASDLIGRDRVAQLILNHGVYRVSRDLYKWIGGGRSFIGMSREYQNSYLSLARDMLRELMVDLVEDIEPYRWLKLAVNAVINPITALLGEKNRIVIENRFIRDILAREICGEILETAKRYNITLPKDPYEEVLRVARDTSDNYSSMLSDVIRCKRTEIDYINGAVVEYSVKRGFKPIYNQVLYYMVKAREEICLERKDPP